MNDSFNNIAMTYNDIIYKLEELESNDMEHDRKIELVFEYLKQLENSKIQESGQNNRARIGYKQHV